MPMIKSVRFRKHVTRAIPSAILGATAFYLSYPYNARLTAAESSSQIGPPLSFTSVKSMYSATGQLFESKTRNYKRSHDGSIVNSYTQTFPEKKPLITEIMNASTGKWMFLDAVTHSVTTLRKTPEEIREALSTLESEGCPDNVDLKTLPEAETIAGVKTVYYVQTSNGEKIERWMAPDLACVNMREIQTSYEHNGAHNEEQVQFLQRA